MCKGADLANLYLATYLATPGVLPVAAGRTRGSNAHQGSDGQPSTSPADLK